MLSKLYFKDPRKPEDASKTYYIDDVIECLKTRFLNAREDSLWQSIGESMAKFKGRSTLKQFQPLKRIKRGIKLWERCDSCTGYVYDMNVYSGAEKRPNSGGNRGKRKYIPLLGEQVVEKLITTIRNPNVVVAFDRFFTSVNLMNSINYAAVGTCMLNRKNMPRFSKRLKKHEFEFQVNRNGIIAARWYDCKEVIVMSNCHYGRVTTIKRTQKDGKKIDVPCPEMISLYNKVMGGVDLSDQKISLYNFNRKSGRLWKKLFFKLLMAAVVNSWIIYQEHTKKVMPLLNFIVPLAGQLVKDGKAGCLVCRKRTPGRYSKKRKLMKNIGDHLPIQCNTRRRCARCSAVYKKEKRTNTICCFCKIALCKDCFAPYHS